MIHPLKSNSLDSTNYDSVKRTLSIKFKDGSLATYENVPASVVEGLHRAKSAGFYFNVFIRNHFKSK